MGTRDSPGVGKGAEHHGQALAPQNSSLFISNERLLFPLPLLLGPMGSMELPMMLGPLLSLGERMNCITACPALLPHPGEKAKSWVIGRVTVGNRRVRRQKHSGEEGEGEWGPRLHCRIEDSFTLKLPVQPPGHTASPNIESPFSEQKACHQKHLFNNNNSKTHKVQKHFSQEFSSIHFNKYLCSRKSREI